MVNVLFMADNSFFYRRPQLATHTLARKRCSFVTFEHNHIMGALLYITFYYSNTFTYHYYHSTIQINIFLHFPLFYDILPIRVVKQRERVHRSEENTFYS